ncbi:MAG: HAD family hydrolase [Elusimicrobiaceae bacterium]|nr:HAD family hydrolase [Elusimicrobiaceae bacterium]
MSVSNKAVFFDRDGTLIYDYGYLSDPAKVHPYKCAVKALTSLQKAGYHLFIVSNQSGIGRGYFSENKAHAVNKQMCKLLRPVAFDEIVFCPHAPNEKCTCRKPLPKLGINLIKKYHLDPTRSFMVGDKKSDVDFGHAIGCKSILVRTANGNKHLQKYPDMKPDCIANNLLAAARFILRKEYI